MCKEQSGFFEEEAMRRRGACFQKHKLVRYKKIANDVQEQSGFFEEEEMRRRGVIFVHKNTKQP